jgi:hypothetical protein
MNLKEAQKKESSRRLSVTDDSILSSSVAFSRLAIATDYPSTKALRIKATELDLRRTAFSTMSRNGWLLWLAAKVLHRSRDRFPHITLAFTAKKFPSEYRLLHASKSHLGIRNRTSAAVASSRTLNSAEGRKQQDLSERLACSHTRTQKAVRYVPRFQRSRQWRLW